MNSLASNIIQIMVLSITIIGTINNLFITALIFVPAEQVRHIQIGLTIPAALNMYVQYNFNKSWDRKENDNRIRCTL
jgi:hypothetical protein